MIEKSASGDPLLAGAEKMQITVPPSSQRRMVSTLAVIGLTATTIFASARRSVLAGTIILSPESDIQSVVDANPPGTSFVIRPGIYRGNAVRPKDGDRFVGEHGAIMDGAKVLRGWSEVSVQGTQYWAVGAGIPLPPFHCGAAYGCCVPGYSRCVYPQDLYVDNADYRHVTSLAGLVSPKTWYYDLDGADGGIANNIYLGAGDAPNSHTVELGEKTFAFRGTASDITIKNLIIEKYASPIQSSAIQSEGPHWSIEDNEIRLNHGGGISALRGGDYIRVFHNRVHHNGQFGIGGPGSWGLWDSNLVAYNNIDGVNPGFEAGGSKFVGRDIIITNNIVHDNYGTGLWTDSGGIHDTYDHNTVYNNFGGGIRYEISRYGVIKDNTVYGNTKMPQIAYAGSDHGRIIGNRVIDNGQGAIIVTNLEGTRPRSRQPVYKVVDTQVTGNSVETKCYPHIAAAGLIDYAEPPDPSIFADPSNFFDQNTYRVVHSASVWGAHPAVGCWAWGERSWEMTGRGPNLIEWSAWQSERQEMHGSVIFGSDPTAGTIFGTH
jgi:parallel beta-helix repeat protein